MTNKELIIECIQNELFEEAMFLLGEEFASKSSEGLPRIMAPFISDKKDWNAVNINDLSKAILKQLGATKDTKVADASLVALKDKIISGIKLNWKFYIDKNLEESTKLLTDFLSKSSIKI